jgi:hypothetical protein
MGGGVLDNVHERSESGIDQICWYGDRETERPSVVIIIFELWDGFCVIRCACVADPHFPGGINSRFGDIGGTSDIRMCMNVVSGRVTSWYHSLAGVELHDDPGEWRSGTVTCDVRAGLLCRHCVNESLGKK